MRLFRRGEAASTLDLLIAGLGNPGARYERDRHNAGWMVVDELARRLEATFKSKFDGRLCETKISDSRVALLEPETYMNESGRSISAAVSIAFGLTVMIACSAGPFRLYASMRSR